MCSDVTVDETKIGSEFGVGSVSLSLFVILDAHEEHNTLSRSCLEPVTSGHAHQDHLWELACLNEIGLFHMHDPMRYLNRFLFTEVTCLALAL